MAAMAAALVILMVVAAPAVQGVQHIVGDNINQWSQGVDYVAWAASNTFTVGDTLLFVYGSTHKVDEVNQADYASCSFDNSIESHDDGNTSISLTKVGPYYFVCPVSTHCAGGMKLAINVVASTSGPTGSPPTTPSNPSPPSGSTSPTTPNIPPAPPAKIVPPPPTPSEAASIVCNMKMLGVTVVSAALLVAFMG